MFSHLGVALERRRRVARELRPRPERVRTRHEHAVVSHTFGRDGEPTPTLGVASKRGERRRRDGGFSPRESSRRLRARFPNRDGEREPRTNHPSNRDESLSNASREHPRRGVRVRATPPRVKRRPSQPPRRHATIHPTRRLRQIRRGAARARPRVKGPRRRASRSARDTPSNRDPTSTRLRRLFRPRRRGSRERSKSDDAEDPTRRLGVGDARAARLSRARGRLLAPSGDERARETCRVVFGSLYVSVRGANFLVGERSPRAETSSERREKFASDVRRRHRAIDVQRPRDGVPPPKNSRGFERPEPSLSGVHEGILASAPAQSREPRLDDGA